MTTMMLGVLFGSVGVGFFIYGKKQQRIVPLACGIGLMLFPYVISNVVALIGIGVLLTIVPFVVKI